MGSVSIGVSDAELVDHLFDSIEDLSGRTCIVGPRKVPVLQAAVGESLARTPSPEPVTSDRLSDVGAWLEKSTEAAVVVCYFSLWRADATNEVLEKMRRCAPVGSRLVFVEPTIGPGWGSWVQRLLRAVFVKRLGFSFHRDIPQVLRAAGWEPTTVKRVSVGIPASIMTFVVGEARAYGGKNTPGDDQPLELQRGV